MVDLTRKPSAKHFTEHVQIAGMRSHLAPAGFIILAKKFHAAACLGYDHRQVEARWMPVEKFLACRAIELGLKSFLSLKGRELSKLAGGVYGHDLNNLLLQADVDGLADMVDLSAQERSAIEQANRYYFEKVFEYPAIGEAVVAYPLDPPFGPLCDAGRRFIEGLYDVCLQQ
ncbi:hypothetical protein [Rhodopseudomonas sp.]|uniref:hypothetical protein n=1 Tax=Rhodopseudomonas sp. TaxID=1078 RepID=UPI0039E3629E